MTEEQFRRSFVATDESGRRWAMPTEFLRVAAISVVGGIMEPPGVEVAFPDWKISFGRASPADATAFAASLLRFAGDEAGAREIEATTT